jgi:hypothetical protein
MIFDVIIVISDWLIQISAAGQLRPEISPLRDGPFNCHEMPVGSPAAVGKGFGNDKVPHIRPRCRCTNSRMQNLEFT